MLRSGGDTTKPVRYREGGRINEFSSRGPRNRSGTGSVEGFPDLDIYWRCVYAARIFHAAVPTTE
jgi:hypothetical protein